MNQDPTPVEIIYEDQDILIINKSAGLLSIRDGYHTELPFVASILQANYSRLYPVHRLDKNTSGIMVFARSPSSHKYINTQFFQREIKKSYHALIIGCPQEKNFTVELPLTVDGDRQHRTTVDRIQGKPAFTDFSVIESFAGKFCWINAIPHTGYTHQIRSHLAAAGFPIISDPLYCPKKEPYLSLSRSPSGFPWIARLALHAFQISFHHPTTNRMVSFTAPHPTDFLSAISTLRSIQ